MALFESRFKELAFYVDGVRRGFVGGKYKTEVKAEIDVLSGLVDVQRVDVPAPKAEETAPKPEPKKAPAKRKPSAK